MVSPVAGAASVSMRSGQSSAVMSQNWWNGMKADLLLHALHVVGRIMSRVPVTDLT